MKPILVTACFYSSYGDIGMGAQLGGGAFVTVAMNVGGGYACGTTLIPPGKSYLLSTGGYGSLYRWSELR